MNELLGGHNFVKRSTKSLDIRKIIILNLKLYFSKIRNPVDKSQDEFVCIQVESLSQLRVSKSISLLNIVKNALT